MSLSTTEIKNALKEAREALKNKDAATAQKQCRLILDQDADHYMALVLMGASQQENDPRMAATFLRRAVKLPNNNLAVALQGLSLCAEPKEMPDICKQLLDLVPDRYEDLYGKLFKAAKDIRQLAADVEPFVQTLQTAVQSPVGDDERRNCARFYLAKLYVTNNGCAANAAWRPTFLDALQYACSHPCAASAEKWSPNKEATVHAVLYKAYLKLLYTLGASSHSQLLQHACNMFELFDTESYPLECICSVYVECSSSDVNAAAIDSLLVKPIAEYTDALVRLCPRSPTGLMASAIVAYRLGLFVQARELLKSVYNMQPDWDVCSKWLAQTYQRLCAWAIAEAILRRLPGNDLLLAECLVAERHSDYAPESIRLCEALMTTTTDASELVRLHVTLAKAHIAAGQNAPNIQTAVDKLTELGHQQLSNLIRALHHFHCNRYVDAVELLANPPPTATCEHLLLLARCYFAQQELKPALNTALAATKLEPFNSDCFHLLAELYALGLNDRARATKCYEKCLLLNERHAAAIGALVATHSAVRAYAAVETLLCASLADPIAGLVVPCPGAWLLLGTNRLRDGRFNDAVTAFRLALRETPTSLKCWIGLADTYQQRGSLSSALKVYQKCLEMRTGRSDSVTAAELEEYDYAQLQVASIRSALGQYAEAVQEFDVLLAGRPNYPWALKGLADAHMGLAHGFAVQKLFGRARQHAAEAVSANSRSLRQRTDLATVWREQAIASMFIASLSRQHAHVEVASELWDHADGAGKTVTLRGDELYTLANKCIVEALNLRPDDMLLWYDYALLCYQRTLKLDTAEVALRQGHLKQAAATAKFLVSKQPERWQNWNLLGVISATEDIGNAALAQHSFIRAVMVCRTAAPAWTNLGVLYAMRAGDVRLANRAFSQAQQAQTDYVHGWTGQACLAEQLGQPSEAIDLFQHATRLQYSGESAVGFVHWVCSALSADTVEPHMRYVCERMFGATEALDSIEWYLRAEDSVSVSAWCFAGYLYYGRSMWPQAVRAFERAVELADGDGKVRDKMLFNFGTSLLRAGRPVDAQRVFHAVVGATFDTAIGLAVAHQMAGEFEDAYGAYESALQLLAQTDAQRAQTLVAMSSIVYQFQGEQDAKSLLFQCIGLPEPPLEGLFSACAVGIIHQDMQLSELVLKELQKYTHDARYIHHIAFLTAQFHVKTNRTKRALMYLLSQVHMHPDHLELRKVLANFILQNASRSESQLTAASRVAESTIVLRLSNSKSIDSSEQGAQSLALASEAMRCVDQNRRKKLAQRAVHVNPTCREAWAALLMCD